MISLVRRRGAAAQLNGQRGPRKEAEREYRQGRGGEGGGCYSSRMEMEEVFKTAGFRVREAEARGLGRCEH